MNPIIKIFTVLVFLFQLTTKTYACDCEYQGSFMKMTQKCSLVALVKVTKYLTFKDIYGKRTPMSMEVEIVETYKGKEFRKTITVWGDIGNLCRPYLSTFKEGQYYLMALYIENSSMKHPDEKKSDYAICNCGAFWLAVDIKKSRVSGDIESKNRKNTTLSLTQLKKKLTAKVSQ